MIHKAKFFLKTLAVLDLIVTPILQVVCSYVLLRITVFNFLNIDSLVDYLSRPDSEEYVKYISGWVSLLFLGCVLLPIYGINFFKNIIHEKPFRIKKEFSRINRTVSVIDKELGRKSTIKDVFSKEYRERF